MTITDAVRYNEDTDSMTDAAFVNAWATQQEDVLISLGHSAPDARRMVNASLIAMES